MENKDKIKLILQRWKSTNVMHDQFIIEVEITQIDVDAKKIWEMYLNQPLMRTSDYTVVMAFDENKTIELASSEVLFKNVTEVLEKLNRKVETDLAQMCIQVKERLGEYIETKETITAKQDIVNREIEKLKEAIKCTEFLKK